MNFDYGRFGDGEIPPTIIEPRSLVKDGKCKHLKFLRQNNLENDEDFRSKLLFIELNNKIQTRDVLKKTQHVKIKTSEIGSEQVRH